MSGDTNPTTPAAVEWSAAEREAVTDICTHEGLGKACDRCRDTIFDALDALAPFVAERERQAAARGWSEGFDAGWGGAMFDGTFEPDPPFNPYRADRIERGDQL